VATLVVDTNVLIDYSHDVGRTRERLHLLLADGNLAVVTPIQVAEFWGGLKVEQHPAFDALFATMVCIPILQRHGREAGRLQFSYARRGIQLQPPDCLIAAVALEYDATLLTENPRHFPALAGRVASLRD
jgi:predicted nucleic acid-binding protein